MRYSNGKWCLSFDIMSRLFVSFITFSEVYFSSFIYIYIYNKFNVNKIFLYFISDSFHLFFYVNN